LFGTLVSFLPYCLFEKGDGRDRPPVQPILNQFTH
jgi:hypothetical protein